MRADELIAQLEEEYPNDIMILADKSKAEVDIYIAKLEMIAYMKEIVKG